MLLTGVITPNNSPWNSPLLLVPKRPEAGESKKWRVMVDFLKLNVVTVKDADDGKDGHIQKLMRIFARLLPIDKCTI